MLLASCKSNCTTKGKAKLPAAQSLKDSPTLNRDN